jgi:pimeloyl-ACP methyl ester carboxylesterase
MPSESALIAANGGRAVLFGFSSGGALALRAAGAGIGVQRIAVYEAPFMVDSAGKRPPADYGHRLDDLIAAEDRSGAVKHFMCNAMGMPRPAEWSTVTVPALVVYGGKSPANLQKGSRALADVLPNAQLRALEGLGHRLKVTVLAPVLAEFFAGRELGADGDDLHASVAA